MAQNDFRPSFDIGARRLDCGDEPRPDSYDAAARAWPSWAPYMDWSRCAPTPDQVAINRWLSGRPLAGAAILHIGAGNSSVALLFAGSARSVDAVSVAPAEIAYARRLALPGYTAHLVNKYGEQFGRIFDGRSFDYIIDNNLFSYACCQRHAENYLGTLRDVLAPGGVIVTHRLGLRWTLDAAGVERAWRLDRRRLHTVASSFGWQVAGLVGVRFLAASDTMAAFDAAPDRAALLRLRLMSSAAPAVARLMWSLPRHRS